MARASLCCLGESAFICCGSESHCFLNAAVDPDPALQNCVVTLIKVEFAVIGGPSVPTIGTLLPFLFDNYILCH